MVIIVLTSPFHKKVALLAIHKNRNGLIFGVGALGISEYRWQSHCADNGLDINHHIRFLEVSRGQLLKLQKFMLPIIAIVVPSLILVG